MRKVVNHSAAWCRRAMIMPNLSHPVTSVKLALEYYDQIQSAALPEPDFQPLMTIYLTPDTKPDEIVEVNNEDRVLAVKYYPAGATTRSEYGVSSIDQCTAVFEKMEALDIPLSVHGEVADAEIDIFDREKVFIDSILVPLRQRFPALRIILEHATTAYAVDYVLSAGDNLAATITPHHLIINRNDVLVGGIKPHNFCFPIAKLESDRLALIEAATGGNRKFFLGTDSAPHPRTTKESAAGKAGIYSAFNAISLYAELFESVGKLDRLESFASEYGAEFYGLPINNARLRLVRDDRIIPESFSYGHDELVPFKAGQKCAWRVDPSG